MTFNVLTSNRNFDEAAEFIREQDPDFIVLLEVDQDWAQAMTQRLQTDYPTMKFHDRPDNFGVAMMSRIPWQDCSIIGMGRDRLPAIDATFELPAPDGGRTNRLEILGVHPIPPMRSQTADRRNSYLLEASQQLDQQQARIMTGDFNLSPWSPWFTEFNRIANTRDAAVGHGPKSLSPTWYVFPTPIGGLKIDHALVSPEIMVSNYQVSPDLGSDHRAILIDFQIDEGRE